MSTWRIYMLGSIRVHKRSHRPCMPEYGSEPRTLHLCVCICICEEYERCLLIVLSVMKIVEVDFIVPWIFYSLMMFLLVLILLKCFWELIGLLSNYHNNSPYRWGARMVLQKCRTIQLPGPWMDLGDSSAGTTEKIPAYLDTPSRVKQIWHGVSRE